MHSLAQGQRKAPVHRLITHRSTAHAATTAELGGTTPSEGTSNGVATPNIPILSWWKSNRRPRVIEGKGASATSLSPFAAIGVERKASGSPPPYQ
ncbi:MAG: hypothetical protein IT225_09370 [Flavobacteriales bacterium]|nr:hypothetical protein [Flavobacteriales bacterium]